MALILLCLYSTCPSLAGLMKYIVDYSWLCVYFLFHQLYCIFHAQMCQTHVNWFLLPDCLIHIYHLLYTHYCVLKWKMQLPLQFGVMRRDQTKGVCCTKGWNVELGKTMLYRKDGWSLFLYHAALSIQPHKIFNVFTSTFLTFFNCVHI